MIRLFASILTLLPLVAQGQSKRVLFLGNSYTNNNNLPQIIADIASSVDDTLFYDINAPSGTLQDHAANSTSVNKIMLGNWDFVVLQGSNLLSMPIEQVEMEVFPFANYLDSIVNTYNPCGETMFYMTWGLKNGDAFNCPVWPPVCTYSGMDDLLQLRYEMMADSNEAVISPVGAVWRYIRQHYPSIELYVPDDSHPSEAGSYAAACCFYTGIFRKDPSLIKYNLSLSPTDAENIRTAVKLVMYNSLLQWHIGQYDLVSDFSYTQLSEFTFQFNNLSRNEVGQIWNFGTAIDTADNPIFTFDDTGIYSIELTSFSECDTVVSNQVISVDGIVTGSEGIDLPLNNIIYPNPAGEKVFINLNSTEGISIEIYSLNGENVITIEHLTRNEIDTSSLKRGLYLMAIIEGNDVIARRLVIQK